MIPVITIFVRHKQNCPYQQDEFWKKCRCRKHFRYTVAGKQRRVTAKTRSWEQAERNKRQLEARLEAQLAGEPIAVDEPRTVEYAVAAFLREKQGGKAADNTLGKYRLTSGGDVAETMKILMFCRMPSIHFFGRSWLFDSSVTAARRMRATTRKM